jgi:hypothetical protein
MNPFFKYQKISYTTRLNVSLRVPPFELQRAIYVLLSPNVLIFKIIGHTFYSRVPQLIAEIALLVPS